MRPPAPALLAGLELHDTIPSIRVLRSFTCSSDWCLPPAAPQVNEAAGEAELYSAKCAQLEETAAQMEAYFRTQLEGLQVSRAAGSHEMAVVARAHHLISMARDDEDPSAH